MNEDMHSLLGRYFSGEATAEEKYAVKQWVQASRENEAEFTALEQLWNRSGAEETIAFDTEKAWQKVNQRIQQPVQQQGKVVNLFKKRIAIAVAASLVLVAAVWWLIGRNDDTETLIADAGTKEVVLEDGTKVYLRKGATLNWPRHFAKDSRQVTLTGEAFFDVTPDPSKPFMITADEAMVKVVGTSFTVNANAGKVELVVKTGRVQFGPLNDTTKKVLVEPGEKAVFEAGKLEKESNTNVNFNAWQTRHIVFENTPLPEVAKTLSDYFAVSITIKKDDAEQLVSSGVTASFNDQSLQSVLDELSQITTCHIQKLDDTHYEIGIR